MTTLPADHPDRDTDPTETILCNGCQGLFSGNPKDDLACPWCGSEDLERPL